MKIATDITKEAEIIMKDYKVLDSRSQNLFLCKFSLSKFNIFFLQFK